MKKKRNHKAGPSARLLRGDRRENGAGNGACRRIVAVSLPWRQGRWRTRRGKQRLHDPRFLDERIVAETGVRRQAGWNRPPGPRPCRGAGHPRRLARNGPGGSNLPAELRARRPERDLLARPVGRLLHDERAQPLGVGRVPGAPDHPGRRGAIARGVPPHVLQVSQAV